MTIMSPAFSADAMIPARFTCDGQNISPPLEIGIVPAGTKTLALIMDDPDAPSGLWVHWVKFNMPPNTRFIAEGKEPPGTAGVGSGGNLKYYGPCPPSGTHHYYFKIYALDNELALSPGATAAELEAVMDGHMLGYGQLVGVYYRHE
ncbi:YbhB/YbcL family Raf kinase inhibitor-like protein [Patescibacteria group bacterium]|nr:YbhB/YbcL family Raf kinase inhibitor-like protein [Patescibacteria group bacterium]